MIRRSAILLLALPVLAAGVPSPLSNDHRTVVHALNRIGYGPRPGDIDRVRGMGLARYIEQQLHPDRIPDTAMTMRLAPLTTLQMSTAGLFEEYYLPALRARRARRAEQRQPGGSGGGSEQMPLPATPPGRGMPRPENRVIAELTAQRLLRAASSERQLQEVLVDFWFNHFNVFAGKGQTRLYLTEYERDTIRPHVLGRFRDLLGAVAKSPAMLVYLDNWMNTDPNGADLFELQRETMRRLRNRATGRPGMAGRAALQPPTPVQRRGRGINENYARELMELHALGVDGGYTQKDVTEVARAFTGWTLRQPRRGGAFTFEPRLHDNGEKIVLGRRLRAGGGQRDGEQVLDMLAAHPSTARFIATKLARRFVADDPPAALVARAARRFTETRGDIREVVRTILLSPEFVAPQVYRAKVKTPLEFVASAVRASNATVETAAPLGRTLRELGMPLYFSQPPTGYADQADAWVNTGALVARMKFALALVTSQLPGVTVDPGSLAAGADAKSARELLIAGLLGGDASESTRATLAKTNDVTMMAALAIGAPEFQRR